MITELTYFGKVDQSGKLQIRDRKGFKSYLLQFIGKDVTIDVKRKRSKRSDQQNRLWWVYMTILSNELGYTKDEIHEICKFKFLKREKVDENTGEIFEYIGSTTSLTKSEFMELVAQLQQWSSEMFNIVLPSPGEQMELI